MNTALSDLGVAELLAGYRDCRFTPVDAVESCLARLDGPQREDGGVVTLVAERALAEAAGSASRWAAGAPLPLDGVPFGAKDLIATADVRTTLGSARWADWIPCDDAASVARLRGAGAVLVAKLATPELGFGDARDGHRPRNPWAPEHWTGGSSSGPAVALASRRLPLAIGTDTGGSNRVPASYCGVTGFKPTRGLVPRGGASTVSWTLDHVGPMARSAADVALALAVLASDTDTGPIEHGCTGVRLGVPTTWFQDGADEDVLAATAVAVEVLADLGATVHGVEVPNVELAGDAAWVITVAEFAEEHADWRDHVAAYTPAAAERLAAGSTLRPGAYRRAMQVRDELRSHAEEVFQQVDVLVTPATPTPAPRLEPTPDPMFAEGDRMWLERVARNLIAWNLLGLPALVVPAGRCHDGRPLALQIVGRPHADRQVLSVGAAFQSATDHHRSAPQAAERGAALGAPSGAAAQGS